MKAILGIKKGMTRVFEADKSVPVTVVDVSDCVVANITADGVELGCGKEKSGKALAGKYAKLGFVPAYREVFSSIDGDKKIGDKIENSVFSSGDIVYVSGIAKGKGFAGVVKRWGFAGGPKTHGQSDRWRAPGSIGAGTDPGRVIKGKRMGGRMGGNTVTLKNRKVVSLLEGLLLIKGPLPGNNGDFVIIKDSNK
jgi:large subunit ribosomal protein L3